MNTVPTSSGCLLLIDSRVTDYQDIINATQSGVQHLVFHVEDIFHVEDMNTEANPFEYIQTRISELGVSAYTNVGLIQHNMRLPVYSMFGSGSGSGSGSFDATITDVETADPTLQTWAGVSGFITHLKNTYGVQNFDMMACALYSNPDWKYVIDTLAVQTGVTVRASTDDTGAAALGGDWFLESHTGVNLKDVYFTEAIEDFRGVLIYSTKYDSRSYFSTKSMAVGKAVAWGATNYGGGTDVNTITGGVITSGVVALYSTGNAFAALKTNGSVSTWGANGGNQTVGGTSPSVASSLTSGVVEIYTNENALAALKSDGTVITWGFGSYGGSSTSVDLTNVVDIFSGKYAFAALKSNGSLVTWPSSSIYGGNSSTAASGLTSGVVSVNMAIRGEVAAAAALKSDGSVVTWPTSSTTGGNSSTVTSSISSGVVVVYSDNHTFAALKNNGSVINWGDTTYALDGNTYVAATSVTLSNIVTINNGAGAYAALNINGGVVTWGLDYTGGNSSGKSLSSNVVKVYNSLYAFAALKFDGSVVTWGGYTGGSAWGGNSTSVASDLSSGVVAVYGNYYAFAALKSNGKVITWGDSASGGSSSSVATDISAGIVAIYTTVTAFAALRNDGKLITWGDSTPGGNSSSVSTDLSAGVVSVNNTNSAFAAITSTATTFDLSMSYYRDIDRYNILRNKENRRRVNLATLNNNVFTLSSARDIQKFNYTIPSGNSFRIIVPDYVSSNYSIISTATLPSPAAANYIIACDEGEPVTISGVTYINYGAFVYRRNVADNTFTKMTSAVIDGVTYNLYGGDGLFSSGIAFQYRFGAFAIAANFGDASFNITAPVTDSSGAFTYTSSDTTVATVTTGGTVTIIKIGSTTITATQAANGRFTSDSITASLVVGKADSTLGALTVPAKVISDAPFTLTAPTSSNSSIVSPVNTITSTASVIVPPPDILDISYGTAWAQMGLDILGTQAQEYSGYSVSISADGTTVAIGSYFYDKAGGTTDTGTTEGRTRVYKYNGTAWTQLGLDISGTQAQEYSGVSVSLSADGTIVAIGSRYYDITGTNEVGRTRIYKYNGSSWGQLGLDISGTQAQEYSGVSVSLSADGTTVAIGSWYYDTAGGTTNANTDEGRTRIYKYNGSAWGQLGLDISGNQVGENSGYSVSLSADGTTVAIGSYSYNVTGIDRGRTRVYKYNGSAWGQLGLDISGTQVSEYSGWSVSLSADGTTVAIGSYFYDKAGGTTDTGTSEGRTRVYKYNGTAWGQLGLDISGTQAQEYSGISVSLSEDGTIVAIGSHAYDKAGGITDTSTGEGRTRVYKYNGTSWTQLGLDVLGTQVAEGCGYSVTLSADGTTVAIGSNGYDKAGGTTNANTDEGRTRIYKIPTTNALTYSSSSSSIADVCGNLLLIKGVNGTSTITSTQNGNTYTGRLDVSGTTYTLQYNPFTYTIDSSSVASVSTYGTVTLAGTVGTSTITATQPETLNYATRSVTGTLVVSAIAPTIGALTAPAKNFGDASFNLTAPTSNSGGEITYTSSNAAVATVTSGGTVTVVGAGSTTITATQAATTNYTGGSSVTASLVVSAIAPTIGALTAPAKNFADASFNLTAPTSNSDGAFTYTSSAEGVATVTSGGMVTVIGAGSTTITATQAATTNYTGGSVTASLVASAIAPTIGALTAPAKNFGDASFNLTAPTSNSDGAFTYTSSAEGVTTVTSGGTVTIVGAGSTTITATQAATTNYTGGSVTASLVVSAIAPTIGALTAPAKNFGDASFNLASPTSNSDGAFTYTSSAPGVATVTSGGTVTVVGAGSTTITATQAASADGNYTGGSSVTASLVVSAIAPTYQSISQITKTYSTDVSFSLTSIMSGVSNSSGAYTFSTTSAAIDICGGVATILAYTPSAITITATQAASGNYNALGSTTFAVLVNRKVPSYGAFSVPAATYEDAPFSIAAYAPTTDSTGVPFTYTSSEPTVATINSDGTVITIIGQGYTTITASQAAGGNYAASSTTTSFLVNRAAPTFLKAFTITNKTFGDASFSLLPFTEGLDNTDGTYHFTSSNAQLVSISEIDSVTATIHAYTPTPITIYVAIDACGNYAASSTSGTLTVLRARPTFGAFTVPAKNFRDASFNITAPTSDSSGTFTYSSSNTSVATVTSGGVLTVVSAGSTTITATQEINGNYTTRDISASLVVSPIAPTIGALSVPAKNFGDASFNLTAPMSDSGGAITYTSSNTAVATVTSGGTVTVVGVGSTTITATQAATTNYSGGSVTASLVVSASLSNFSVPENKYYGDASFNLVDPDTTDNTVGFTFASSNTSVATLSGGGGRTVTIVGAGSTTITATQAATANRGELNISATLVVHPATPVITLAPITKSYGNSSFRLSPSSTNTDTTGGSVFTFSSDNISVVSFLDASLVRINGIGTATIAITQAASANFTDASSSVVITVNKGASGFSASTFAVAANKTFGDAAFAITTVPIGSSTGAITYASSDEAVAVITSSGSGNAITLVGQGTATFTASQEASALYTADTKTSNTLTVARKTAALTRDTPSTDTITKYYGNAAFTVIATNESNGAFSFTSSDPSFATIDASTGEVSIVAVGSTTLTATRAQTAQYNAASVSWTLNIARGTTTLTGLTSMTRNVTVAPFTVSATSASNGAVSYALQDLSSTVLTIHPTSGLVRLLAPGSAVIVASQLQGTLYEAPSSITATITVSEAGNILEGTTLTTSINYANVDLSGASLANVTITNTNFSSGRLNNTNFNGASINSSNMTSTDLSGATMRNATITGTDFTSANLRRTDLSGANVRSSIFNSAELSGSTLIRLDASGASFINANLTGANLSNADFTNANMTNANIDGADITNVTFTTPQKLQLLKNRGNRVRSEIQVSQVLGSVLLPILSAGSTVRDVPNVANATFKVMIPSTSLVASDSIVDIELDITNFTYFYFPIGENEYFKIQGVKYYISGSTIINYATGASVENTNYGVKAIRLLAGSLTIIVNAQNTLSASSFVVPSPKINTDAPFSPTTLPTSNSSAPIVYSSSNTNIATIHSSTGVIAPVEGSSGFVRFTASQVATQTHESSSIMSNELLVNRLIDFTLVGLNQTFSLSTLATLDASSISLESTDATAVFYVRLSDMTNLFQYQTDSFDVNNVDASDIKYYMFQRSTPTEFRINPSHAMMNKTESAGMLGSGVQEIGADKSLVKHDFIRYIALRLFNTHYAVDLFQNEQELHENLTYLGETIRHNIDTIVSGISTTSASETMAYDASGNKYLTNDVSGNTNLCRELMRQIAASEPSRFYNHGGNTAGLRNMPLQENDSINFKLTITAAAGQNVLTGVSVIPSRSYMIKMVLKNTVNTSSNDTNTAVTDSEMYPNSYPYSTSVTTYAPTAESSSGVYNVYSPPAPIPTSRFGFTGWYYANTTTWVNVAPAVRDRVKWVLPPNAAGSSTVADLRYVRMNLKVFNTTSLPFLVVYTQAGSYRKYTISAPNSLANGTVYSFYVNFNSYAREPATVGATIAALTYSNVGTGSFANGEVITSIAIESDNTAAAGTVEFTLSSVVVGEASSEKEYGLSAAV